MSTDSRFAITALVTNLRSDIQDGVKKVEYSLRKAMADEIRAYATAVEDDPDLTNEKVTAALNNSGVLLSMAQSQLGTMGLKVAQFKAKAAKELERNQTLAERIVGLEARLRLVECWLDNAVYLLRNSQPHPIDKMSEQLFGERSDELRERRDQLILDYDHDAARTGKFQAKAEK